MTNKNLNNNKTYATKILAGSLIGSYNSLNNSQICGEICASDISDSQINNAKVLHSYVRGACVQENSQIGVFAHLREGSNIMENCRIGNFVETKKAVIKSGSKVSHLTYVGDAIIGKNVNVGCGTVFCNYNGKNKQQTVVGDNVFIGYGAIVLPNTRIGNNVIIGAGCVVAKDIPENSVVIGNPCHVLCSYDEYLTKNKEQLMKGPVFHKAFSEKTKAEKQEEFDLLSTFSGGYDL